MLRLLRIPSSLLSLLGLAAAAQAQTDPSSFTAGYRYDAAWRLIGTIAPDPDGGGPLRYAAVRNVYDSGGRLVKVEKGELNAWQSETEEPKFWPGFTIHETAETAYDSVGRETTRKAGAGSAVPTSLRQLRVAGRLDCEARRREENVRVNGGRQSAKQVERAAASNPNDLLRHSGHKLKGGGQGRSHFQTEGKRGHTFYDVGAALVGGLAVTLDVLDQATNPLNDSGLSECQDRGACQNGVIRTPEQREQYIQEQEAALEEARRRAEELRRRGAPYK